MAADAASDQKNVTVADGSKFQAGFPVKIKDAAHSEWNEVDSALGTVVTMKDNLANTYYVSKGGLVEGPDSAFGRGTFACAFAVEFLCGAYSDSQFSTDQAAVLAKIVALSDWFLVQQCADSGKEDYGGFVQHVNLADEYGSTMATAALYCLIGLKMLGDTYDAVNASRYETMLADLESFTREGFEKLFLYYQPPLPVQGNGSE